MKVYRYPGVRPFEAADKALFFGRDRDIADLYEMIRAERLVVLFGKSGYGKSSLLNAGVLPRLRQVLTPVEVRLGEYIPGQSLPPVETVRGKAPVQHKLKTDAAFLAGLPTTLWTHFKQLDSAEKGAYLLVFDQFEEFFSYPPEQQRAFRDQLADLLSGELPEDLREAARALDREQRRLLTAPMDIRVLFAIRSDRLHELDRLKDRLPAILHKRYELKALSREQAREAIIGPAALTDPRPDLREGRITMTPLKDEWAFASPPFEYREDALTNILNGLAITATVQQSGVEAFQLQILCDSIESRVADGLVPDRDGNGRPDVTAADLPDFTEVFAQYYERRLAHLPETERAAARRVIEDGLVRYDPFTDEGRRLSVDGQALLKDYENIGLHPDLLRELENTFLVRREPNTLGGHNYELSHDTLLAPVVRAKKQRMAEEEEQRRREERAAEEARIAHEKAEAQRRQRRALFTSFIAVILILSAVVATTFAVIKTNQAERAAERAVIALLEAARKDILLLNYDAAFAKMKDASNLGSVKDSVAFELMEIAFFRYHAGQTTQATEPFSLAAKLLGKSDVSPKNGFDNALTTLDRSKDSLLKARYFPVMIDIKGGTYTMGSDDEDDNWLISAKPPHQVTVSDFKMAQTETTVWQYNLYLTAQGKNINDPEVIERPGWGWEGNNPVVNVSWYGAIDYANWLSGQQWPALSPAVDTAGGTYRPDWNARGYRLPTEAEWEYAAKGGAQRDPFPYSGGNELDDVAWYGNNSGNRTQAVATKKANGAQLFDMSGNVWEWCWDWRAEYTSDAQTNPRGPDEGAGRVLRGGGWITGAQLCRAAYRLNSAPDIRYYNLGFRLVRPF